MKSRRWNLWVPDLQMSRKNLTTWQGNVTMMTSSFPRDWPFVRGIPRWPVDYPYKGQCCGALIFSLICAWTNGWANNRDAGETPSRSLWRHMLVKALGWHDPVVNSYPVHLSPSKRHRFNIDPKRKCWIGVESTTPVVFAVWMTSWHRLKFRGTGPLCVNPTVLSLFLNDYIDIRSILHC